MTSDRLCVKENDEKVQPLKELVTISIQWLRTRPESNSRFNKIDGYCWEVVLLGLSYVCMFHEQSTDSFCSGVSSPGRLLQTALEDTAGVSS